MRTMKTPMTGGNEDIGIDSSSLVHSIMTKCWEKSLLSIIDGRHHTHGSILDHTRNVAFRHLRCDHCRIKFGEIIYVLLPRPIFLILAKMGLQDTASSF